MAEKTIHYNIHREQPGSSQQEEKKFVPLRAIRGRKKPAITVPEVRSKLLPLKKKRNSCRFVGFVAKNATQNPDFLPRAFNVEEMRKDVELMQMLQPVLINC